MDFVQIYLKYKSEYLFLKKKSFPHRLHGGHLKKSKLRKKFNKMIGGFGEYINALTEIFAKFAGDDPKNSIESDVNLLGEILEEKKVSSCHGIDHAKKVMYHAWRAIQEYDLSKEDQMAVLLAALLHDADDGKFFPDHKNYENLRKILQQTGKSTDFIENVVQMVSIVSSSKNGDTIPTYVVGREWMLVPRYADRIEAIGIIGIERCYTYTKNVSRLPLYLETTPRATTEETIWKIATPERYNEYKGKSLSMIDHYYDKLLRLATFPIKNKYFDDECSKRRQPLIDLLLQFGRNGSITGEEIEEFIKERSVLPDEECVTGHE